MCSYYSSSLYGVSGTSDESDACRHYVWAGMMAKHLGPDFEKNLLDAHEAEPNQPIDQKSMDMANNRAGILAANQLIRLNQYSNEKIVEIFMRDLKQGKLIVLKPGRNLLK